MATQDVKDIVKRLEKIEKIEKQNRRHKFLGVFVIFSFLILMVSPQLSAISVPSLDDVWNAINDINDFIKFESDLRSKKFVAQGFSNDDTPRTELDKNSLEFYSNSGLKWCRLDNGSLTYYNSNGKRVIRLDVDSLNFYDNNGNINGTLRSGKNAALGINTGYPRRALHVSAKGTMVQARLQRTGNSAGIVEMGTANDHLYFYPGGYMNKTGNVIFDTTGKVGIGVTSPQAPLHVKGSVKALNIATGDIVFHKDGQKLWRMFEDEHGLYLENIKTKKVYSLVLKEVK